MHKAKVLRYIFLSFIYITFSLGSTPNSKNPQNSGMLFISIFDKKSPETQPSLTRDGIFLFSFEV